MKSETAIIAEPVPAAREEEFPGGFPAEESVRRIYDDLDLNRAIQAYRFFYPTVSGAALWEGHANRGVCENVLFGTVHFTPQHIGYAESSDMPCGIIALNLRKGPMLMYLPPGPIMGTAIDLNQRWVADLGLIGPDEGRGGTHLLLPPGYSGHIPRGVHARRSGTFRVLVTLGSIPVAGDVGTAIDSLKTVVVCPLEAPPYWADPDWVDVTSRAQDTTPASFESSLGFWEALYDAVQREPFYEPFSFFYGELAALGITKGRPFAPDERLTTILETAAVVGNRQMRTEAFADRRPERIVWRDRRWEWVSPMPESEGAGAPDPLDPTAREKWFFQAAGASPSLFARQPGNGVVSWLGLRDKQGRYLDGGRTYRLRIPQPVPAKFFWSLTVYDAETRSQVRTSQGSAAIRSGFELNGRARDTCLDLYVGAAPPPDCVSIQTIPRRGWFALLRAYGPEARACDGSWKPGDFEEI